MLTDNNTISTFMIKYIITVQFYWTDHAEKVESCILLSPLESTISNK